MVSIPFEDLEDPDSGYPIANIKTENFAIGNRLGHKILIWDIAKNSYRTYHYTTDGWKDANNKIVTADDADACIYPGQSCYISGSTTTAKATFSGKVVAENVEISLKMGANFIANPYVTALPITSIKGDFATGARLGNKILRWNGLKYDQYDWTNDGWKKVVDVEGNTEASVTTDSVDAGEGFILSNAKATSVTLMTPIKLN